MARILIVDDEPDVRFMMRVIFEGAGYKVTEARHGGLGLKSVKARQPDLVITDIMMPTMDGLEFIECLRSDPKTAAIPILVVSGNSVATPLFANGWRIARKDCCELRRGAGAIPTILAHWRGRIFHCVGGVSQPDCPNPRSTREVYSSQNAQPTRAC